MIGFDIGGSKCAVCLGREVDGHLEILNKRIVPTDHSISPYEMIERMCKLAKEMTDTIDCIGISCGGPLDSRAGVIQSPPNLPGWDNVEIVSYLEKRYGIKAYLQNDANACAVAEWLYGAGRGCENMIFLTFGTGMGAGLILNGRLYSGTNDMAGEIGHIRLNQYGPVGYGKAGSFEGFCSGSGLAQLGQMMAREKLQMGETVSYCESMEQLQYITAKTIAEWANEGCEDALAVYRLCGVMLGQGLSILIDVLNPECIVLGSVFQRSGHLLRSAMEDVLARECLKGSRSVCRVIPALLKGNIGDYAALAVATMACGETEKKSCGGKGMLYDKYPALEVCREDIEKALKLILNTYRSGGKVLVCGNGGSAADSEHIVGELMKGFLSKRPVVDERIPKRLRDGLQGALPAISLPNQSAILSAFINDVDPEMMYAQLVYGYAGKNDLLIGLSTSGNSGNVVNAIEVAKSLGMKTLSLTGQKASRMSELSDVTIRVPETETYKVQEYHLPVYHYLCAEVEREMFG